MLKENEATKNIPVIIFSANDDIRQISKKVNADGYVEKPFNITSFVDTIQKHTG